MNLTKLFEAQRLLDERIEQEHPRTEKENRLKDKCLALLVELGECANEQRTWKFWSQNRNPVTKSIRPTFGTNVDGTQHQSFVECNPLLEEYIDVLHFALSIGNEIDFPKNIHKEVDPDFFFGTYSPSWTASDAFGYSYRSVIKFMQLPKEHEYLKLEYLFMLKSITTLGRWLEFTSEQIEAAYFEKNKINHQRQEEGY